MTEKPSKNIEISERDGRTTIIFKKAALKGRVSSSQVLDAILIAAQMQAEKYIEKLSRGAPLDPNEIKALKELADITKLQVEVPKSEALAIIQPPESELAKQKLYSLLAERIKNEPS